MILQKVVVVPCMESLQNKQKQQNKINQTLDSVGRSSESSSCANKPTMSGALREGFFVLPMQLIT